MMRMRHLALVCVLCVFVAASVACDGRTDDALDGPDDDSEVAATTTTTTFAPTSTSTSAVPPVTTTTTTTTTTVATSTTTSTTTTVSTTTSTTSTTIAFDDTANCDETVWGTLEGRESRLRGYASPCDWVDDLGAGPEFVFRMDFGEETDLTVTFGRESSTFQHVLILTDPGDAGTAVACGDASTQFHVESAGTYFVVVDLNVYGWGHGNGPFTLDIACGDVAISGEDSVGLADDDLGVSIEEIDFLNNDAPPDISLVVDVDDALHARYTKSFFDPADECGYRSLMHATNESGSWEAVEEIGGECWADGWPGTWGNRIVEENAQAIMAGAPRTIYQARSTYADYSYQTDDYSWGRLYLEGESEDVVLSEYECGVGGACIMNGRGMSLAFDESGTAGVSFSRTLSDFESNLVYEAASGGSVESQVIDACANAVAGTRIAIDSGVAVHIAYRCDNIARPDERSVMKYATDVAGDWEAHALDVTGSQDPNLALDAGDGVHIAYVQTRRSTPRSDGVLKYAVNQNGSWTNDIVPGAGEFVEGAVMVLDPDDFAHIAFRDNAAGNEGVKYATNRTGAWEVFIVDARPEFGTETAIAIDSQDIVHVVYGGGGTLWHAWFSMP
ncbi:MAG: hypothetical protein KJ042_02415 [Deltaproteobacteria bacterium]|nr:hypothetical protein [Deltaproteobacteria bacterium]